MTAQEYSPKPQHNAVTLLTTLNSNVQLSTALSVTLLQTGDGSATILGESIVQTFPIDDQNKEARAYANWFNKVTHEFQYRKGDSIDQMGEYLTHVDPPEGFVPLKLAFENFIRSKLPNQPNAEITVSASSTR